MKLKLRYNPTYTFTLSDIYDSSDDEMTLTAKSKLGADWANIVKSFREGGSVDLDGAMQALALALTCVTQDGVSHPLNGVADIQAIHDSIEEQGEGFGDIFIRNLVIGHFNLHWNRIDDKLKNSNAPLSPSTNGANPESVTQKTAKEKTVS